MNCTHDTADNQSSLMGALIGHVVPHTHDSSFERKRNISNDVMCILRDNHVQGCGYPKRVVNATPTIF